MSILKWKYVKKLKNNNVIKSFESDNSIKLPQDIISCMKENNGGRPDKKTFDTEETKGRVMKSLLSFNADDLETVYDINDILKKEKENLFPFASDPSGNYICYNTKDKDIVLWLHETNKIEKIADSFTSFINMLY